ncbi:3-oxoadipate--succinyl-CoA transferase subunit B [Acrocarpospora corrugata]|uniref:3-oxoadipate--succinyl-CoA transferase subunit B n=1 Tax=Acrocarpospora corrugata TaxID=35763 RepID=A0A5M3VQX4_9ACTN|nr:CoA-transferase [Acrocarpospora corrugata]GER99186.1 3-oxoadipate--succinyl-CoA transferase subunit B [Acrocarpospora corrugata]
MPDTTYTWAEMMAISIAHEMADGDFGSVGAASHIPVAGLRLAQLTHAPNLSFFCGGSGAMNPKMRRLTESSADYRNLVTSEYQFSLDDVVDFETAIKFDFAFLGGMQIDKHGNLNMAVIGPWEKPKVRGPGTIGLIFLGGFKTSYIYTEHHTPRIFVDKVDFVSGAGWLDGGDSRSKVFRPESDGPRRVFTPLGVFDFEPESRRMRLIKVHPWSDVERIRAATGFELLIADDVTTVDPPTEEELRLLRTEVDTDGVLRRYPATA